jgi:hypothetical protein
LSSAEGFPAAGAAAFLPLGIFCSPSKKDFCSASRFNTIVVKMKIFDKWYWRLNPIKSLFNHNFSAI